MAANGTPIMWLDDAGLHVCDRIGYERRWFDGCGCCHNEVAIVSRSRHADDCQYAFAMALAAIEFVLDEWVSSVSSPKEGNEQ